MKTKATAWVLGVLAFILAIVCLQYAYDVGRMDEQGIAFQVAAQQLFIWLSLYSLCMTLLIGGCVLRGLRRLSFSLSFGLVMFFVLIASSFRVGHYLRLQEIENNRQKACKVIAAIVAYRQTTGQFPKRLEDLNQVVDLTVSTGNEINYIEYKPWQENPTVVYRDGWYTHCYNLTKETWEKRD